MKYCLSQIEVLSFVILYQEKHTYFIKTFFRKRMI